MFNFFNKEEQEQVTENSTPSPQNNGVDQYSPETDKKKVHGEDGVCCGSCGGQ